MISQPAPEIMPLTPAAAPSIHQRHCCSPAMACSASWQDGKMVLRWMASASLETEKHFRKVMGHRELWILKAALRDDAQPATIQIAA
jgi:hypothetical protein